MSQFKLGCCIPGMSFMPEGKSGADEDLLSEICCGCDTIIKAGFDFAEIGVGMVMRLSDDDFEALVSKKLPLLAANSFIPFHFHIVSDGVCEKGSPLYEYVDKAFCRMSRLGIGTVVFGSGGARRIPDGMDREMGLEYICVFLRMCGELGEKYGVTVAIEPLRKSECNAVNLTSEGEALAEKAAHKNVRYLADAFHMCHGGEPADRLLHAKSLPVHIHISEAPDRTYPGSVSSSYLADFAKALKQTDYSGLISVECGFSDFEKEVDLAYDFASKNF